MSLVEIAQTVCQKQMADIADRICQDYKSAVQSNLKHPQNSSGEASGSIHVEKKSDYVYRIGASNLHLYFFEMGNGGGGIPKGGKKPRGPMPMTYGARGTPTFFAMHASNYAGKNIKAKVAAKYGG